MRAGVFAGPTISGTEIASLAPVERLPPAALGDVLRAVEDGYAALLLVDGYFHSVPSVQHKELLYAISRGVAVLGCSSMGALRAAELQGTPMVGVGEIFRAFRDGILTDDDEVAVAHAQEEDGYRAMSTPMVAIREGLDRAARDGVLDRCAARQLTALAKARFYADRHWSQVYSDAAGIGIDYLALRDYVEATEPDPKRRDAVEALRALNALMSHPTRPLTHQFAFEPTNCWDNLRVQEAQTERNPRVAH